VCVVMIGAILPFMEGAAPLEALSNVGILTFAANGAIAFALNVAGVFLIDSAGSLVLTLSGIFKVSPSSGGSVILLIQYVGRSAHYIISASYGKLNCGISSHR
jgi:hypothetical protein